jgi:hypothetical protein
VGEAAHHVGIVEIGTGGPWVINLPGPGTMTTWGRPVYEPTGYNDIVSVPLWLFNKFRPINRVARFGPPPGR